MHGAQQRTTDTAHGVGDRLRLALDHEAETGVAAHDACGPDDPFVERLGASRGGDIEVRELDGLRGDFTDGSRRS